MKKLWTLALLGLTLLGCNSENIEMYTSAYSGYITDNKIETDIHFMPMEVYPDVKAPQKPIMKLKLLTEKQFPCINYGLKTTQFQQGNELIVRFDEIIQAEICLTALGPAVTYIDLPENINKLTLINGNVIDRYAVDINAEKMNITLIEEHFTKSLHEKTFRVPENSFAYVCGTNTTNTNIYGDFLAILKQNPNFKEFEFQGEGRIPYPETANGHWVNHPSKFFIYSNPSDYTNLQNVLTNYSKQNIQENSGVTIAIYGWDNLNFSSWN
jgi:hypothetical protein